MIYYKKIQYMYAQCCSRLRLMVSSRIKGKEAAKKGKK